MGLPDTAKAVCVLSFVSFSCLNKALDVVGVAPKRYTDESRRYKWRNAAVSFAHAAIIGFGGAFCLLLQPALIHDQINVISREAEALLCLSMGYLLYDIVDLIKNEPFMKVWPQVLHHALAIVFPYLVVSSNLLYGIASFAMSIEISGVFLHSRILLLMYDFERRGLIWNANAFLNLATFIVVRLGLIVYIIIWSLAHKREMPQMAGVLFPWIAVVILCMNLVIFRRLITSDYIMKSKASTQSSLPPSSSSLSSTSKEGDVQDLQEEELILEM